MGAWKKLFSKLAKKNTPLNILIYETLANSMKSKFTFIKCINCSMVKKTHIKIFPWSYWWNDSLLLIMILSRFTLGILHLNPINLTCHIWFLLAKFGHCIKHKFTLDQNFCTRTLTPHDMFLKVCHKILAR